MSEQPPKSTRIKSPRELLRMLLMLDDTDHSIALGSAIGIGIGLTPTVGIQMLVVVCVAFCTRKLFHFNRMAAIVGVYISNPLTMIPLYWFLYKVGTYFVAGDVSREQFAAILEYQGLAEWWQTICDLFVSIGWPLMIGTAIVAPIGGVLTYPLMRWLLRYLKPQVKPQPAESVAAETTPAANEPVSVSSNDPQP